MEQFKAFFMLALLTSHRDIDLYLHFAKDCFSVVSKLVAPRLSCLGLYQYDSGLYKRFTSASPTPKR